MKLDDDAKSLLDYKIKENDSLVIMTVKVKAPQPVSPSLEEFKMEDIPETQSTMVPMQDDGVPIPTTESILVPMEELMKDDSTSGDKEVK